MTADRNARDYWDAVLDDASHSAPIDAWRSYMQGVYRRLIRDWLPVARQGHGLKTDLFEEAVTPYHLLPDLTPAIGIDYSLAVARSARRRLASDGSLPLCVVGDLRRLPFRSDAVERILSGSSLDHFLEKAEIATSLRELARVLTPGGTLVVSFDNPHNPVVWLRNHLPFGLLNRLGLVPYYVGATYRRDEARQQIHAVGLTVTAVTAVAHVPRAPAVWVAALVARARSQRLNAIVTRLFGVFEVLGRWPTRYRTGYYLAIRAAKPASAQPTTAHPVDAR
ncbi:MAG: class I SAM-dependent methyltransferase [Gemmatimonadaceae bacterium]